MSSSGPGRPKALSAILAAGALCFLAVSGNVAGQGISGFAPPKKNLPFPPQKGFPGLPPASGVALVPTGADWFPHGPDETALQAWIRRRQEVQVPVDPEAYADALEEQARALASACVRDPLQCRRRDQLNAVAAALRRGSQGAPGCGPAADAFGPFYEASNPPRDVALAFDLACFGSFERRLIGGAPEQPVPMPAIFGGGGTGGGQSGALSAIGLLELDGQPFCGSLIRNDRTLVTARHCFSFAWEAMRDGRVTVRPVVGQRGPWRMAARPVSRPESNSLAVRDDWIVLQIDTTEPIGAAETVLEREPSLGPVSLAGHYAHFNYASYAQAGAPEWRRGLRFPRPDLCQTIKVVGDCLQLACETVRGFSGTPVFRAAPAGSGSAIPVVGFISQRAHSDAECPTGPLSPTLAVSSAAVR